MEFNNNFCESALGLCMCYVAMNTGMNLFPSLLNTNIQQSIDSQYMNQSQLLQTQADTLQYQMLQQKLQMQMQQSVIPTVTFPSEYTEKKKKVIRSIYDLDKIIFPYNPIRDWTEKKCKEIEEKYKWLHEVEWRW